MKNVKNIPVLNCLVFSLLLMWICTGTKNALAQSSAAITPQEIITLFNGEDLSGFYTWLEGGLDYEDPSRVFSLLITLTVHRPFA